jgi:hypothetical protein
MEKGVTISPNFFVVEWRSVMSLEIELGIFNKLNIKIED